MSVAFVVPAFGRVELGRVCLAHLRHTCDQLTQEGVPATAVVVADDDNLHTARDLGFATVEQENLPLGRKWNDGIEYACAHLGVTHVVPFGTDNWADWRLFLDLPEDLTIRCRRLIAIVNEDGTRLARLRIRYDGGDGIRVLPAKLLEPLRFRPAGEDRKRAIDTSVHMRLQHAWKKPLRFDYQELHSLQIVGFQSDWPQLNKYEPLQAAFGYGPESENPWWLLSDVYPAEFVGQMREHYSQRLVAA